VLLPKSGVMSYNLYKISDMRISKALKHPNKFKDIEKREIDFDSIDKFMKRSSLYIYSILKNNPVDIITYPESSSEFNKDMVEYIMDRYKKSPGIKCIPNLMSKNIRNVYVNFTVAKELGLSDEDINRLRHDVENWKSDADVYDLRVKIDELNDYIAYHSGKRGRPTNEIKQKKELVKNLEEQIKILRKGRRGKDKTKSSDGKAKNFEIKSIEDKRRRSLEGLFGINPKLSGIQQDLKGKHIVIFDDNISSGATLDDICLELQKQGVASILPITLAIIPKTVYGQEHESLKNR
jgi:hypoxanthine phosphoribosyltransferase